MKRRSLLLACAAAPAFARTADPYGRLLIAYPPGGLSDEAARRLAQVLALPVDHRPGAGGRIALDLLGHAGGDGRTLCYAAITPLTVRPQVLHETPPAVAPVVAVMQVPTLLVATSACAERSLAAVLASARAAPGRLRWATSGIATTGHLVLAQLRAATGVDITHIPYKGGGAPINDALAGHVELLLTNAGPLQMDLVRRGQLHPIAVGGPARLASLPGVPTFAEQGLPKVHAASVFGVFAPERTPADTVNQLNRTLASALDDGEWRQRFEAAGCQLLGGTPEAFAARVRDEADEVRRLVAAGRVVLD